MRYLLASPLLVCALLAGCGSDDDSNGSSVSTSPSSSAPASPSVTGEINVFAAASLQEAFTMIGKQFEAANSGAKVIFNFGPSSGLATQINQGAPADVFASASQKNMDQVVDAGGASNPMTFVENQMEIATPPGNPADVTSLNDLAKSSVKVALCQPQVPCGTVAAQVFKNAGVTVMPVTLEADVKAVLTKVTLGEVDAGVVYVTDVKAAGDKVKGVEIPADVNASTPYPIAPLIKSGDSATAQAFVDYVLSDAGQQVLTAAGFAQP
jgi:molybdate transport system substrate-binding protein